MLLNSSDEDIGALIQQYKDNSKLFEKNLIMLHIKSDGHLSLNDVYNMTYKMRELYIEAHNEFGEEQKRALNK
jgi:hypothetical protein